MKLLESGLVPYHDNSRVINVYLGDLAAIPRQLIIAVLSTLLIGTGALVGARSQRA